MKHKLTVLALGAGLMMAGCSKDEVKADPTPEGYVYWTDDGGRVFRISENGGRVDTLQKGMRDPEGIAFDAKSKKLLVIENSGDSLFTLERTPGHYRSLLINRSSQPIMNSIGGGIVCDGKGNYWLISNYKWITKGNVSSASVDTMFLMPQSHPGYALAINREGTTLYWATNDGKIWKGNADGTGAATAIFSDASLPRIYAIAVDDESKQIYFANDGTGLCRMNMDGTSMSQVTSALPAKYLYSLVFDPDKKRLYLGNYKNNVAIYYMKPGEGNAIDSLTGKNYGYVYGITIY